MSKRIDYSNISCVEQLNEEYNLVPAEIIEKKSEIKKMEDKDKESHEKKNEEEKTVNPDKFEVIYADQHPKELKNIFKHIIVFTNDRDPKNNKTLKNIIDAIDALKKKHVEIVPELHVFVAAEMVADDREETIELTDGDEKFTIKEQSNLDTLVFSRLGVQDEDQCEHIVKLLQDRGFLVLNPVQYAALACDKYDTACLLEKGEIPQPRFCLMTKDILYDEKQYNQSMKDVYPQWNEKDPDKNEELTFVCKILDGHGGTGVAMIDGKKILAWLQLVFAIDPERRLILQKKEEADGGDIRVHVLTLRNKQVILAAMKRVKIANDFRSNVSLGAAAEPVKLTPEQEQIALKTATLTKMPWCAVDIMPLVKGSNKELGDNVVLEVNASPGTDGISDVIKENFVSILLNELDDPSEFMLQDKTAGFIEAVTVKFEDGVEKSFLAKLDTGNSTFASTLEVGEYTETDGKVTFSIDGKNMTFDKERDINAVAGEDTYKRPVIQVKELTLGLRKIKNPYIAIVKSREKKTTNMLLNRDTLAKLGYTVHPNNGHMLTDEMQKVKII
jgi:glutathione synthase/RimK-type ligase-like ATP-grasp enzyme